MTKGFGFARSLSYIDDMMKKIEKYYRKEKHKLAWKSEK